MIVVSDMTPLHYLILIGCDHILPKAIQEAQKRGLRAVRMLTVLDDAAERGLVADLPAVLDHLEQKTTFYVSKACKQVIEDMKRRDTERKLGKA